MILKKKYLLIYYFLEFSINTISLKKKKTFVKYNTFEKVDGIPKTYGKQHSYNIQSIYETKC